MKYIILSLIHSTSTNHHLKVTYICFCRHLRNLDKVGNTTKPLIMSIKLYMFQLVTYSYIQWILRATDQCVQYFSNGETHQYIQLVQFCKERQDKLLCWYLALFQIIKQVCLPTSITHRSMPSLMPLGLEAGSKLIW